MSVTRSIISHLAPNSITALLEYGKGNHAISSSRLNNVSPHIERLTNFFFSGTGVKKRTPLSASTKLKGQLEIHLKYSPLKYVLPQLKNLKNSSREYIKCKILKKYKARCTWSKKNPKNKERVTTLFVLSKIFQNQTSTHFVELFLKTELTLANILEAIKENKARANTKSTLKQHTKRSKLIQRIKPSSRQYLFLKPLKIKFGKNILRKRNRIYPVSA